MINKGGREREKEGGGGGGGSRIWLYTSSQSSSADDEDSHTLSFCNSDCLAVKGFAGYEVSEERDLRVKYIYTILAKGKQTCGYHMKT